MKSLNKVTIGIALASIALAAIGIVAWSYNSGNVVNAKSSTAVISEQPNKPECSACESKSKLINIGNLVQTSNVQSDGKTACPKDGAKGDCPPKGDGKDCGKDCGKDGKDCGKCDKDKTPTTN